MYCIFNRILANTKHITYIDSTGSNSHMLLAKMPPAKSNEFRHCFFLCFIRVSLEYYFVYLSDSFSITIHFTRPLAFLLASYPLTFFPIQFHSCMLLLHTDSLAIVRSWIIRVILLSRIGKLHKKGAISHRLAKIDYLFVYWTKEPLTR